MNLDLRFFWFSGFKFRLALLNLWVIKWNFFLLNFMLKLRFLHLKLIFFTVGKWNCSFNHSMVRDYGCWILHYRSFRLFLTFDIWWLLFWCLRFGDIGQSCLSFLRFFLFLLNDGFNLFLFFLLINLLLSSFLNGDFSLSSFWFVFICLFVLFACHLMPYQSIKIFLNYLFNFVLIIVNF